MFWGVFCLSSNVFKGYFRGFPWYFQTTKEKKDREHINFSLFGTTNSLQGNAGKLWEVQGFPLKNVAMPSKRPIRELREIHSGDPKWAFWGDFPWRMRMAKVSVVSQTIAAAPPLPSVRMAYRNSKTDLTMEHRRKRLPLKPIAL